ncbi:MAG TPA: GNAT family N-acetyltransferase [Gaiellaceae bacterium]
MTGAEAQGQSRLELVDAVSDAELASVRELFQEYAGSLGFDLGFQDFERELSELPGDYAPPRGRLVLARIDRAVAGCVAVRPLKGDCCEMKRLYVRPAFRGAGAGRALAQAALDAGRAAGYARMRLDTVPQMGEARRLYRSLGFTEIEPYRFNPIPGTAFMEIVLADGR